MIDERCQPCAEAGFPNILAAYKGVKAGASHDGKAVPPMCYDHKHGQIPKHILRAMDKKTADEFLKKKDAQASEPKAETEPVVKKAPLNVKPVEKPVVVEVEKADKRDANWDKLKVQRVAADRYEEQFGPCSKKHISHARWELWEMIRELPLTEYLLLPVREGETTSAARSRYAQTILRCKKLFKPDFDVKLACNHVHNHIVLEKVALK